MNLSLYSALLLALLATLGAAQQLDAYDGVAEFKEDEGAWRPADIGDEIDVRDTLRTFEGDLSLALINGSIRLNRNSELTRGLRTYDLVEGKAFVNADGVLMEFGGPLQVEGELRLDHNETDGHRAALLSGYARVTVGGRVLELEPGQQIVVSEDGETSLSEYYERDPWYRDILSLGEGVGQVIGFEGEAELDAGSGWLQSELGMAFEQGHVARTGAESWLELRFDDDNLVRLQADSQIILSQLEDLSDGTRRTVLELSYGKVWAVVENEGEPFEIETPGLVAGVRGTTFRIDAATAEDDALLKTFDGEVTGILGFETVSIDEGQQFEPEEGVEPLELDALDSFNLVRDQLVNPPDLRVSELPAQTTEAALVLEGSVEPVSVLRNGNLSQEADGTFTIEYPLKDGFNLVEVSAQEAPGTAMARYQRPVIRAAYTPILELLELKNADGYVRVKGLATPGAKVSITGAERAYRSVAARNGRFAVNVPESAFAADLSVSAEVAGFVTSLPLPAELQAE